MIVWQHWCKSFAEENGHDSSFFQKNFSILNQFWTEIAMDTKQDGIMSSNKVMRDVYSSNKATKTIICLIK